MDSQAKEHRSQIGSMRAQHALANATALGTAFFSRKGAKAQRREEQPERN